MSTSKVIPETWGNPPDTLGSLDTPNSKASKRAWPETCFDTTELNQGRISIILPLVIFKLFLIVPPVIIFISALPVDLIASEIRFPKVHSLYLQKTEAESVLPSGLIKRSKLVSPTSKFNWSLNSSQILFIKVFKLLSTHLPTLDRVTFKALVLSFGSGTSVIISVSIVPSVFKISFPKILILYQFDLWEYHYLPNLLF